MEEELEYFYFRFQNIVTDTVVDTAGAVMVGFVNIGQAQATLNGIPLLTQGVGPLTANYVQNILWLPISNKERDATAYRIIFNKSQIDPLVIAFIKMVRR